MAFLLQADELDGEIDLRCCTDVTEYAVQRNYGFQIHVRLCAGVRGEACLEGPLEHSCPSRDWLLSLLYPEALSSEPVRSFTANT